VEAIAFDLVATIRNSLTASLVGMICGRLVNWRLLSTLVADINLLLNLCVR